MRFWGKYCLSVLWRAQGDLWMNFHGQELAFSVPCMLRAVKVSESWSKPRAQLLLSVRSRRNADPEKKWLSLNIFAAHLPWTELSVRLFNSLHHFHISDVYHISLNCARCTKLGASCISAVPGLTASHGLPSRSGQKDTSWPRYFAPLLLRKLQWDLVSFYLLPRFSCRVSFFALFCIRQCDSTRLTQTDTTCAPELRAWIKDLL